VVGPGEQRLVARRVAVGPQLDVVPRPVPGVEPRGEPRHLLGAARVEPADNLAGEPAVGTGHQLDRQRRVYPEVDGQRPEVGTEGRRDDHRGVPLTRVPPQPLEQLGPQALEQRRHVGAAEGLEPLGRPAAEQLADDSDLERIAVAGPAVRDRVGQGTGQPPGAACLP
jgi:hypothetical protein